MIRKKKKTLDFNEMRLYDILSWEEVQSLSCFNISDTYRSARGGLYTFGNGGFIIDSITRRREEEDNNEWKKFLYEERYIDQVIRHNSTIKLLSEMSREEAIRTIRFMLNTTFTKALWNRVQTDVETGEFSKLIHSSLPYDHANISYYYILTEYFDITTEEITGDLGTLEKEYVVVISTGSKADIYTKTSSDIQDMYFK